MQNAGQTKPAGRPAVPTAPPEFQADKIMAMDSPQLVAILKDPNATQFQKSKACMRLAVAGTVVSLTQLRQDYGGTVFVLVALSWLVLIAVMGIHGLQTFLPV